MSGFIRKIFCVLFFVFIIMIIANLNLYAKEDSRATMCIDFPLQGQNIKSEMYLQGWVMSNSENISINLYVDNILIKQLERNKLRPDVLEIVKGYGTEIENPKPGFSTNIDLSEIKDGNHIVKIEVIENGKILCYEEKSIAIKKYNTAINIDFPTYNQNVTSELYLQGWVMSELKDINIKLYIDNTFVQIVERNKLRVDVLEIINGYGTELENPKPGFSSTIDLAKIKDGKHTLMIEVTNKSNGEIISYLETNILLRKYKAVANIDFPTYNQNVTNELYLQGWVMSELKKASLQLYIDNELAKTLERNSLRPDVLELIKGYGTELENPKPGFNIIVDLSNYKPGRHSLEIKVINLDTNEIMTSQSTILNLIQYKAVNEIKKGIDVSKYQGNIDWSKVKQDRN